MEVDTFLLESSYSSNILFTAEHTNIHIWSFKQQVKIVCIAQNEQKQNGLLVIIQTYVHVDM